jgi:hypothetical protein
VHTLAMLLQHVLPEGVHVIRKRHCLPAR